MKFKSISNLKSLIERIEVTVIATLDSLPHLCKYSYSYISNYAKKLDICDEDILSFENHELYKEFKMIASTLNDKTLANFKINNIDFKDGKYEYLILDGKYKSLLDAEFFMMDYVDFEKYYRDGDKSPKQGYTNIKVYYRPSANNYLIEHYRDCLAYEDKSSYTKVFNFNELMDYIFFNIEDAYNFESASI